MNKFSFKKFDIIDYKENFILIKSDHNMDLNNLDYLCCKNNFPFYNSLNQNTYFLISLHWYYKNFLDYFSHRNYFYLFCIQYNL